MSQKRTQCLISDPALVGPAFIGLHIFRVIEDQDDLAPAEVIVNEELEFAQHVSLLIVYGLLQLFGQLGVDVGKTLVEGLQDKGLIDLVAVPENDGRMAVVVVVMRKSFCQGRFAQPAHAVQAEAPSGPERPAHLYQIPFAPDKSFADQPGVPGFEKTAAGVEIIRQVIRLVVSDQGVHGLILVDDRREPLGNVLNQ